MLLYTYISDIRWRTFPSVPFVYIISIYNLEPIFEFLSLFPCFGFIRVLYIITRINRIRNPTSILYDSLCLGRIQINLMN